MALSACAAHRTGDAVRSTTFVGNTRPKPLTEWLTAPQTDRALRNAMTHPKAVWQAFLFPGVIEPAWVDPATLDRDGWRLEVWYANHGYFDAQFLGWEIDRPTRPARRKVRPVDLVGHIDQGLPSRVTGIDVAGIERLGAPLARRIWASLKISQGSIWNTDDWRTSLAAIQALLREHSFAFAKVDGDVLVSPTDHEVQVAIRVDAGHPCRLGAVTIVGLKHIPRAELLPLLDIHEGEPYKESSLKSTREKLFALGVFGVVNILPDLSDPDGRLVPIRIELSENKSHEVKAGPEFEFEPGLQTLSVAATYTDNNVLNHLWQLSQTAKFGVASNVATLNDVNAVTVSPVGSISGSFNLPRLFSSKFTVLNSGSFARTLTNYGDVLSAEYAPAVSWSGVPKLSPSVGYRIRYEDILGAGTACILQANSYGAASEYPYLISELEQAATYDGRNDPLSPTRGWYWNLKLDEAGGPFGGLYDFFKAQGEVRAYRSILRIAHQDFGTTVAARLGGGIIAPYSNTTHIPLEERLYLGGGTTVRGWGANELGPYAPTSCSTIGGTGFVPVGGDLSLYGNLELRQPLPFYPDVSLATFLDAGRVWDVPANFNLSEIQYSVGGGLRYNTAIGPIRLDVAWRLGDSPYFAGEHTVTTTPLLGPGYANPNGVSSLEYPVGQTYHYSPDFPRWALHFGLSEAF